jgi:hypothetical protein
MEECSKETISKKSKKAKKITQNKITKNKCKRLTTIVVVIRKKGSVQNLTATFSDPGQ